MPESPFIADQNWFRQLFESSPDPTWIIDGNNFVECNEAAIKTLGYSSREELLNVHPSKLSPPKQADGEDSFTKAERMMAIATEKGLHRFEWTHTRADGSDFAAEVTLSNITLKDREVIYCTWRDITDRKSADDALRQSMAVSEAIQFSITETILLIGLDGGILAANPTAAQRFGENPDKIVGKNVYGLLPPELANTRRSLVDEVVRSGKPLTTEDERRGRAYSSTFYPVFSKLGEVSAVVVIATDVTDMRQSLQLQTALHRISEASHSAIDLTSLLERIHTIISELMSADNFYVAVYDEVKQEISFPYFVDEYDPVPLPRKIGQGGLTETVLSSGEALLLTAEGGHEEPHVVGTDSIDWLGVPLKTERRTVGVLAVQSYSGLVRYTDKDKALLQFVSDHVAMTIERKQAESRLKLAASVFTHAREGIMITDASGSIIDLNDTFTSITGYSRDEVLGQNPRILSSGRQGQEFYTAMWSDLINKGHWYGEIWNRRKNGEVYAEMLTVSAVRDAHGNTQQYVALFTDITSLKEHELELEHIAHYDALTSLPNRVLLADRLQQGMAQAQRRRQPLAVAYLDLDGFKPINDRYGHDIGDQLLMTVANRMKQALREGDTLARLGGDEFVAVLLDLVDTAASVPMLVRLLSAAAQPVLIGDLILQVSASIGVTFYPQAEDVDADQLLRHADQAMYQAKLAGKNRYHVFDAEQDRSVRGHHESLEHIRRALSEHEFVLHYQPKVNMRTGKIIGVEALIRWQHPQRGLLLPAVFLPVIEEHPLAVKLGEWVIDSALTQMEHWKTVGLNIPVSVNVGARQLQQPNFVERLGELLREHPAIRPGDLEIEVLETSALEDLARISQVIVACKDIGVSFALDDFGTGYSSLTYLKHLPVTLLKIDQSFVRNMLDDPDDLAILEGVLGLAIAFRRDVIAEGVETLEHGAMLLQLGCDLAQGYGIARPMPASRLAEWAAVWRPDPGWVYLAAVSSDDLPLLFASAEHRAWIASMESHIQGGQEAPPPLNHRECRFGIWLETKGRVRYGGHPAFQAIDPLHRQVHALATELCKLHTRGQSGEALAGLGELDRLRDALLDQLKALRLKAPH